MKKVDQPLGICAAVRVTSINEPYGIFSSVISVRILSSDSDHVDYSVIYVYFNSPNTAQGRARVESLAQWCCCLVSIGGMQLGRSKDQLEWKCQKEMKRKVTIRRHLRAIRQSMRRKAFQSTLP